MRILFFTYDFPYPLNSGGKIRAYYLIKNLSKNHSITLFSFYRNEEQKLYLPEIKKYCKEVFLFKRRKVWDFKNFWYLITKNIPFVSSIYYLKEIEKVIQRELKKKNYDFVHFESFYPALYLPLVKKIGVKTLMGNENIEWQIYEKYRFNKFFLLRWFLKWEIERMRKYEENLWQMADINIVPSKKEALIIEKITKKKCFVVPNGVDLREIKFAPKKSNDFSIIFIGSLIYQANNDGIRYFLKKIYPEIKKNISQVKFILVSWFKPKWIKKFLRDSSIEFIQDKNTPAFNFFKKADILVVPIRIAGGTRIKILEAMASGLPVVSTRIGVEGIKARDGEEILIAKNSYDLVKKTINLLKNKSLQLKIAKKARKLVEKFYNWEKIGEKLNKIYEKN